MLWRCFDFICSAFSRDKYILGIIGNHIYPDVCSVLISEILSKLIPDNARQLQSFEVHKLAADSFEQALLDQGTEKLTYKASL